MGWDIDPKKLFRSTKNKRIENMRRMVSYREHKLPEKNDREESRVDICKGNFI